MHPLDEIRFLTRSSLFFGCTVAALAGFEAESAWRGRAHRQDVLYRWYGR